jgi:hypothetical protein
MSILETIASVNAAVAELPSAPPLDEPSPEEYWRSLAVAKASEAAANAALDRLMKEATAPRSEMVYVNGPASVQAARAAAVGAAPAASPAPRPATTPTTKLMTDEEFYHMYPSLAPDYVAKSRSAALARSFQDPDDGPLQPVLYGGASPSLTRLLRSRGQEPLNPPEGSYYLPPSAARARRVPRPIEEVDTYTGAASASMRHMLASRGQRPTDDFR